MPEISLCAGRKYGLRHLKRAVQKRWMTYREEILPLNVLEAQDIPHGAVGQHLKGVVDQGVLPPPGDPRRRNSAAREAGEVDAVAFQVRSCRLVPDLGPMVIQDGQRSGWNCGVEMTIGWLCT